MVGATSGKVNCRLDRHGQHAAFGGAGFGGRQRLAWETTGRLRGTSVTVDSLGGRGDLEASGLGHGVGDELRREFFDRLVVVELQRQPASLCGQVLRGAFLLDSSPLGINPCRVGGNGADLASREEETGQAVGLGRLPPLGRQMLGLLDRVEYAEGCGPVAVANGGGFDGELRQFGWFRRWRGFVACCRNPFR
ncbi:hypothetical protein [Dactylosporangium sp. CA-233914]|uniref:hypothetical protein n=1 Tax=Dactylosporangium sp. CA-233914 TaxID=3239934 RepID=UPI003D922788